MDNFWDFHIHSGLSPCAMEDMTPNNIINMALIKELDGIAITDHNSVENLNPFYHLAKSKGIGFLPGVEITTCEEIHVLIFFEDLTPITYLREILQKSLPDIQNRKEIFGNQLIYNINDQVIAGENKLLTNATELSFEKTLDIAKEIDGVLIPAHVDRKSFSILSNLGFIPPEFKGKFLEISSAISQTEFYNKYPSMKNYKIIQNSDAHQLTSILERVKANFFNKEAHKTILKSLK